MLQISSDMERFLPIREGVSQPHGFPSAGITFPPYTGGCIEIRVAARKIISVSSLYGRVYRIWFVIEYLFLRFLPIREGVSLSKSCRTSDKMFPPCMGGCIAAIHNFLKDVCVSSLYGRVYHFLLALSAQIGCFLPVWEGVSGGNKKGFLTTEFPPCMGGCIVISPICRML